MAPYDDWEEARCDRREITRATRETDRLALAQRTETRVRRAREVCRGRRNIAPANRVARAGEVRARRARDDQSQRSDV